jgi:hypothetical protein
VVGQRQPPQGVADIRLESVADITSECLADLPRNTQTGPNISPLSGQISLGYALSMTIDDIEGPDTKQVKCTLSVVTIRYLGWLSRTGVHGNNATDVMKELIEWGIRQAITEGWIGRIPPGG